MARRKTLGRYDNKTRAYAMSLYLQGLPMKEIADKIGVAVKTIYLWKDKEGWNNTEAHIISTMKEDFVKDTAAFKMQQLQEIRSLIATATNDLEDAPFPTKDKLYDSILNLKKLELSIMGIVTDARAVAIKEEININCKLEDYFK